jgi:hypothetical protein
MFRKADFGTCCADLITNRWAPVGLIADCGTVTGDEGEASPSADASRDASAFGSGRLRGSLARPLRLCVRDDT